MLTVGSTFTGVGGADIGLEQAGYQIKWQCELDAWKRSVLAAHWPNVLIYDDITTLVDPEPVDVMIGGFPCQDLSVAGKRKGFNGSRSVLAFEFLRVAESLRPRWLVLENVPGLLSSNKGLDFQRLLNEVVACGYGVGWRCLDARYFGVPQRRRRIFLVARRAEAGINTRAASEFALHALCESGSGDSTQGWPARQNLATSPPSGTRGGCSVGTHGDADTSITGTLTREYGEQAGQDLTGGKRSHSHIYNATARFAAWSEDTKAGTLSQRDHKSTNHILIDERELAYRKARRAKSVTDDETWTNDGVANTLNRFDVGDTRTTHAIVNALDRQAGGPDDNSAQAGHLIPQVAVAPTLTQYNLDSRSPQSEEQQRIVGAVHEATMSVRRLTPIECERLMGWPDNWTAPPGVKAPDSKRYAACGDGIVASVAYWIGQRINMIEGIRHD